GQKTLEVGVHHRRADRLLGTELVDERILQSLQLGQERWRRVGVPLGSRSEELGGPGILRAQHLKAAEGAGGITRPVIVEAYRIVAKCPDGSERESAVVRVRLVGRCRVS